MLGGWWNPCSPAEWKAHSVLEPCAGCTSLGLAHNSDFCNLFSNFLFHSGLAFSILLSP